MDNKKKGNYVVDKPYTYHQHFLDKEAADSLFAAFTSELQWVHVGETAPRKEYYVNNYGLPYTYGSGKFAREYASQETHYGIELVRSNLKAALGVDFDVVFLNMYEHERHHLGWHADDSPEMSDDHPIVTVSLGAEREIWFKKIGEDEVDRLMLHHGSACVMLPGVQDTHLHRIPKCDRVCGPRVSLTFRVFVHPERSDV